MGLMEEYHYSNFRESLDNRDAFLFPDLFQILKNIADIDIKYELIGGPYEKENNKK